MFRVVALLALGFAVLGMASLSFAAPLKVGSPMPSFANLQTTDGKTISSGDLRKDIVVICITCNHCPVAIAYEDRIINFVKKYAGKDGKVDFVAINVNNIPADRLDKMKERAKERGFNFTYAYDPSQKIARDLGATKTPEFFVFHKGKLIYTGAMDDNQNASAAKVNYVEKAVEAALSGAQPPACTDPVGCGIKYEK
ncbi:MAG: thioredoxin family protein [Gemmatales bacterium]|nr:thioredoxin family protein [Gemmatales bacterium]MDW8387159.1 thioredoxin family protein [Gemmatales bacterium]